MTTVPDNLAERMVQESRLFREVVDWARRQWRFWFDPSDIRIPVRRKGHRETHREPVAKAKRGGDLRIFFEVLAGGFCMKRIVDCSETSADLF